MSSLQCGYDKFQAAYGKDLANGIQPKEWKEQVNMAGYSEALLLGATVHMRTDQQQDATAAGGKKQVRKGGMEAHVSLTAPMLHWPLLHWSFAAQLRCCTAPLLHCAAAALLRCCTAPPLHCSVAALLLSMNTRARCS
jgi:hypothetical protein